LAPSQEFCNESGSSDFGIWIGGDDQTYVNLQPAIDIQTEFETDNGLLIRPKLTLGITQFLGNAAPSVTGRFVSNFWENTILESLSAYIEIPNKSPMFDPDWAEHGQMHRAVAHILEWINRQEVPGLIVETHELPGLTPTVLMELPGEIDDTVLLFGMPR